MRNKLLMLTVAVVGCCITHAAFPAMDRNQIEQDRARVEQDKHTLEVDRDRLKQDSETMQRDRQQMMEDQRRFNMDRMQDRPPAKPHFWNGRPGSQSQTPPPPPPQPEQSRVPHDPSPNNSSPAMQQPAQ